MSSASRQQAVRLQIFPWSPVDKHIAITGTKKGPTFIRKHNRSPLCRRVSSSLRPLALQTTMAWSQWNTLYKTPGSELSLNSSRSYCGTNSCKNFCGRRSRMSRSRTRNTAVFPLSIVTHPPGTQFS
ncbi:hypothetical protein TNCV_5027751 [Trichonephila clavipes]|nr:hypothetical protein TNCV_5027751 [Trichonephila clavipes]